MKIKPPNKRKRRAIQRTAPTQYVSTVDATRPLIKVPSKTTLKKYGLDSQAWLAILERQNWVCAICKKVPNTGRFNTDHNHAPNWRRKKPEERRKHVRGIVCWWCNKTYLGRAITAEKAMNVMLYLKAYALRREVQGGTYVYNEDRE